MATPRFGFLGRGAFLNHASVAPPCRAARRAVHRAADAIAKEDERFVMSRRTSTQARTAFARFVGSRLDRVMCFQNTSAALSAVASGLRWKKGDEVWVSRNEFASNYLAWDLQRRHGVKIRLLPTRDEWVDPDVLARKLGRRTRVVALSAVHWATGARQDLAALADVVHAKGALLVVDAAQSLGAARHSPRRDRYDALATNTYKWLLSYNGTAFADFSKPALEQIDLASIGWLSVAGEPEPDVVRAGRPEYSLGRGVEKFLGGAPSALSNVAATAALDDLEAYGQARIEKEVAVVAQRFMTTAEELGANVVTPREPKRHAGIVALDIPDALNLSKKLRARGIRCGSRGGFLRLSPHFYTPEQDREAFARAFRRLRG
jgi:selenocysteine lyase/cysteine desulfurase